jgi:hypothetical protein
MRTALVIALQVTANLVVAQWTSVGGGIPGGQPYDMLFDTTLQRLYVVGSMMYVNEFNLRVNGTAFYEDGSWHPMGTGTTDVYNVGWVCPEVKAICSHDSAIVVAGQFYQMDSVPNTSYVAEWRNEQWHSMGIDSNEQEIGNYENLVEIDGRLNLTGNFTWDINGPIWSWAVWDGESWSPGDTTGIFQNMQIKSLCEYQGQLYAGGNFDNPGFPSDIARWNTDHWEEVGGGINGDPWVNDLAVYDDKLWVCGEFAASWGNAASGLMAWDGQHWLNPFPQIAFIAMGRNVQVANGKLYFIGPFMAQGLPGVHHFGVYDGNTLCIFGTNGLEDAGRLCVAPDTVYALAWGNDIDVNTLGQWPLNAPMDTCYTVVQGETEPEGTADQFVLYPNPTNDQVTLHFSDELRRIAVHIAVQNMLGQEVACDPHIGPTGITIGTSTLATGTYTLEVLSRDRKVLYIGRFMRVP